jgi:hypothetical protein
MKGNRRARFKQIKGKPTHLIPKIVMKEVHGQVVPVKVYPAQYARDHSNTSRYHERDLDPYYNNANRAGYKSKAHFGGKTSRR